MGDEKLPPLDEPKIPSFHSKPKPGCDNLTLKKMDDEKLPPLDEPKISSLHSNPKLDYENPTLKKMDDEKVPPLDEQKISSFHQDGNSHNSSNDLDSDSNNELFDPIPSNNNDEGMIKKALEELRSKVEDAIINNYIFGRKKLDILEDLRDVEIFGVPLLPSKNHEGTDIILTKFLKAKDYKVSEAFRLLRKTMKWRRNLKINELCNEEFINNNNNGLENNMWKMQGKDDEGRPVCYYMIGEFKDDDNMGLREEKYYYSNYMRWRFNCVERGVREIGFREGESNSIIQIIDLNNSNSMAKKEFNHSISRKFMSLVHQHYPGLIHKNLFINVSGWYMAVNALNIKFIKKKTKKKYAFVRSAKVTESLLKLLPPASIPVQYGGFRRENDDEFSIDDKVFETYASPNYINQIKIPLNQVDVTVSWDLTVVGFNVIYKEEFVPNDDCSYEILIQSKKKLRETARNSFHIREPGNIIITIENETYKKKKVFYRYKCKPTIPLYLFPK